MNTDEKLTTIECSRPGAAYSLIRSGPGLTVHLAAPRGQGIGPCICGFDRFGAKIGFSVGGGTTGPGVEHDVCAECARLADGRKIVGLHRAMFTVPVSS